MAPFNPDEFSNYQLYPRMRPVNWQETIVLSFIVSLLCILISLMIGRTHSIIGIITLASLTVLVAIWIPYAAIREWYEVQDWLNGKRRLASYESNDPSRWWPRLTTKARLASETMIAESGAIAILTGLTIGHFVLQ